MADTAAETVALADYRKITLGAARRAGYKPVRMPVEALVRQLPADGSIAAIWERIESRAGVEYRITNVRATAGGVDVVCESRPVTDRGQVHPDNIRTVMTYPLNQGRTVRMLVKAGD